MSQGVFGLYIHIRFDMLSVTPRLQDVLVIISSTWLIILGSTSIKQTYNASEKARIYQELQKEKYETELKMLKAQINPHFLFNTLNSIYVLSKKKSDKTPEIVLKLSQMLDFVLYRNGESKIEIAKEMEFITDYIDLEKVRYENKLDIKLKVDLKNPHQKIEPMLFIPLVENAFKHGVKHERQKARVNIHVSDKSGIKFAISNSKPNYKPNNEKGGIGLENLKGRLEKFYPDNYKLQINDTTDMFYAHLQLKTE